MVIKKLTGEASYPLHMASPHGINPLVVNLDPEGGGPNLTGDRRHFYPQEISATGTKSRRLNVRHIRAVL